MKTLISSSAFTRALKRLVRQNPQLRSLIEQTLQQLSEEPLAPTLRTHNSKEIYRIDGLVPLTTAIELCLNLFKIMIQMKQRFYY